MALIMFVLVMPMKRMMESSGNHAGGGGQQ